jgi:hypothetical protein
VPRPPHVLIILCFLASTASNRLTALAKSKRGLSKFHTIVLRLVGIKVHNATLPNMMMMWREVDMAAAESFMSTPSITKRRSVVEHCIW